MDPGSSPNGTDAPNDGRFCDGRSLNASVQSLMVSGALCVSVGSASLLTACGNVLVVLSVAYFRQLHAPTNYLVASLAVADLLVGVLVLPFSAMLSIGSCRNLAGLLCGVRGLLDAFLCTASILNLCFISIDRYHVVCRPLTYRTQITARVVAVMILASWALPALITVSTTVPGLRRRRPSGSGCRVFQSSGSAITGAVFLSFIPAVVIFSVYLKILTVAHRQARSIRNAAAPRAAGGGRRESKATVTLTIVVGLYLVCWSPYFLSMSLYPLRGDAMPVPMVEAFKWLGWCNSMLNPLVYAFFYKWFRSAFRIILCGKIFQGDFTNSKLS